MSLAKPKKVLGVFAIITSLVYPLWNLLVLILNFLTNLPYFTGGWRFRGLFYFLSDIANLEGGEIHFICGILLTALSALVAVSCFSRKGFKAIYLTLLALISLKLFVDICFRIIWAPVSFLSGLFIIYVYYGTAAATAINFSWLIKELLDALADSVRIGAALVMTIVLALFVIALMTGKRGFISFMKKASLACVPAMVVGMLAHIISLILPLAYVLVVGSMSGSFVWSFLLPSILDFVTAGLFFAILLLPLFVLRALAGVSLEKERTVIDSSWGDEEQATDSSCCEEPELTFISE